MLLNAVVIVVGFGVHASGSASPYGAITIASTLAWGLGYFGMPHILLRFMATSSEDNITLSRRIASVWVVISMAVAILIGGGVMIFIWKYCVRPLGGVWNIYELLPAFLVRLALVVGVSLATSAPSAEMVKEFEEVKAGK